MSKEVNKLARRGGHIVVNAGRRQERTLLAEHIVAGIAGHTESRHSCSVDVCAVEINSAETVEHNDVEARQVGAVDDQEYRRARIECDGDVDEHVSQIDVCRDREVVEAARTQCRARCCR